MVETTAPPVRDPGRAAAFSDAVVAVAMTALVLPLLDIDLSSVTTLGALWSKYGGQFSAFLLSFFIIAIYWNVHHKVWFLVRTVTPVLLWINILWLLGIVLIPFTTIAIYEISGFPVLGFQLYSAVVLYISITLGLMIHLIMSRPELNVGGVVASPWWYPLRFAFWWALVFVACLIDAEGLGQYLLEWSAIPLFALGFWQPSSIKRANARAAAVGEGVPPE
ncbi:MAG: potassium channel family protein [Actinomycetota bacterium]|nr:potassium channel family protein [Actinomycetota bacterium]